MPPFQVIEFVDPTGQEIVHRKPESGSGEFRLGDQLVVQESQKAVIFRDGKALDVFEPGRHTLATANLPLLSNLLGAVFGKSPFRVSVVFVAMKAFLNQGWGTPQPIALRDSEFGMVRLRGFGTYAFRVNDVSLFVNKVVGSQGLYTTNDVVDYLKSILLNAIAPAIANLKLSILDVPSNYAKIRAGVLALARDQFNDYGVELLDFNIESITPTDETAKAIDERAAMGAIGDMRAYLQFKAARALGDAAAKEAAPGADLTGAGLGLGAGIGLGEPGHASRGRHRSSSPGHHDRGGGRPLPAGLGG